MKELEKLFYMTYSEYMYRVNKTNISKSGAMPLFAQIQTMFVLILINSIFIMSQAFFILYQICQLLFIHRIMKHGNL